jgi:hypothetical protein
MGDSYFKIEVPNSETLIVSFAGHALLFGGIPRFEFVNFFNKNFENINKHFYIDKFRTCYHKGIFGLSNNIDETVEYLKNEIKQYKNVIFLGVSAGGYAAILFGSLLNINSIIAFTPQTFRRDKYIDEKYRDISQYINNVTKYYIYGNLSVTDIKDTHHISQCERISNHSNVYITRVKNFNLKKMRDSGELSTILNKIIHDKNIL